MDVTSTLPGPSTSSRSVTTPKSTKGKRARVRKLYYQGYVLNTDWYKEQAQLRFGSEDEPDAFHHRTRFLFGLLADAGLSGGRARFRNVKVDGGGSALCIALASNKDDSTMPPQDKIEKLKSLIGTDEPPKWYEYDG
jgi:hypothetical protein